MSELKKSVQDVVDNLKGKLSVENGVITATDDTVDAVLKPFLEAHNLTEKQVVAVQDPLCGGCWLRLRGSRCRL